MLGCSARVEDVGEYWSMDLQFLNQRLTLEGLRVLVRHSAQDTHYLHLPSKTLLKIFEVPGYRISRTLIDQRFLASCGYGLAHGLAHVCSAWSTEMVLTYCIHVDIMRNRRMHTVPLHQHPREGFVRE